MLFYNAFIKAVISINFRIPRKGDKDEITTMDNRFCVSRLAYDVWDDELLDGCSGV